MTKMIQRFAILLMVAAVATSCVSKKKFVDLEASRSALEMKYDNLRGELGACQDDKTKISTQLENMTAQMKVSEAKFNSDLQAKDDKIKLISEDLAYTKRTNTNLLDRLSDMSIISKTGAESIQKSLESLNQQSAYIQDLSKDAKRKDSLNLALVMNLKRSLADVNDSDIQIDVKKGVVFISISDKLLFKSGSATVNSEAKSVLSKVAQVVNDHNNFDIIVEGHTDDKKLIDGATFKDNWELSAERATSVVRILQNEYKVAPSRMTAGGRGEYLPKSDNSSAEGRAMNRRTEIIVIPKLDEFFQMMSSGTN